jgi:hypothetical protein
MTLAKSLQNLTTDLYAELHTMNKEQLEGASFSLFTLYDALHPKWLAVRAPLNDLALCDLFNSLSNICGKLHTVTRRHKSSAWIAGALEIMEKIRQHTRMIGGYGYLQVDFMHALEDIIDCVDGLLEDSGEQGAT